MKDRSSSLRFTKIHELLVGVVIFLSSIIMLWFLFGRYDWKTIPIGISSWVAIILIVDFFDRKVLKKSFLPTEHTKKRFIKISLISISFCLILDLFGVFFARLWYYPHLPLYVYLLFAPIAFIVYIFLLFILYESIEKLLKNSLKLSFDVKNSKTYRIFMNIEFVLGIAGYLATFKYLSVLIPQFNIPIIDIQRSTSIQIVWWYPFAFLLSTFFIFEFISYRENKKTLTWDLMQRNIYPIIGILFASLIAIIFIEFINSPFQIWIFANWPLNEYRIFNIPMLALAVWPLQFLAFLSMLRFALAKREASIW